MEMIAPLASPDSVLFFALAYADLFIGIALLFLVSLFLPGKVRWTVLTLGLGLIGSQFWQRYRARQEFAKLDEERLELQQRLSELDGDMEVLRAENHRLNERRQALNEEQEAIAAEAATLASGDSELAERHRALSERRRRLQDDNIEAAGEQQRVEAALQRWQQWRDQKTSVVSDILSTGASATNARVNANSVPERTAASSEVVVP